MTEIIDAFIHAVRIQYWLIDCYWQGIIRTCISANKNHRNKMETKTNGTSQRNIKNYLLLFYLRTINSFCNLKRLAPQ